jgi:8-oxo-dGTP diphosphatase
VIEVAAAVMLRDDGSFLLARRPAGKVYAGYWEFPGGKIEPGEPASDALARELHEELGVEVSEAFPWLTRVFTYPHGTVRLNFFRVLDWRGEPHPRENQAIAWQAPCGPMAEPMLPANAPVLASLALPAEYAITDSKRFGVPEMMARIERRMSEGLRLVQVREPSLGEEERARLTLQVLALARRYGCKVLTKAPFAGAHGIHMTSSQLMEAEKRPRGGLVAASCHTRDELARAMSLGLDFVVLGPVRDKAAIGWDRFAELAAGSSLPVYAIGGLTRADLRAAWRAGAHGVAMIRGAWA